MQYRQPISVTDLLKNSFVISINARQFNFFKILFEKNNLKPLPRKIEGFQIKCISTYTRGKDRCVDVDTLPMVNCMYTHLHIIQTAQYLNLPFVCIFEDDAYPCIDIHEKLTSVLSAIPKTVNLVCLGHIQHSEKETLSDKYIKFHYVFGSHAYVIFKEGYEEYINATKQHNAVADLIFQSIPSCAAVKQNLFIQCNPFNPSQISYHSGICSFYGKEYNEKYFPAITQYNKDFNLNVKFDGRLGNILFIFAHALTLAYKDKKKIIANEQINPIKKLFDCNFSEYLAYDKNDDLPYTNIDGYFQSEQCFDAELIRRLYKIPEQKLLAVYDKYKDVDFKNTVALHVRRTDYVERNHIWKVLPAEYYEKAYAKYFSGKPCICVSDDIDWCKRNINIQGIKFINGSEENDLMVFSACKYHICSCSTYAWWGAWLSETPESVNIFPETWFNTGIKLSEEEEFIQNNVIPQRWIKFKYENYRPKNNCEKCVRIKILDGWPGIGESYISKMIDRERVNVEFCETDPDIVISFGFGSSYKEYDCIKIQTINNERFICGSDADVDYIIGNDEQLSDSGKRIYIPFWIAQYFSIHDEYIKNANSIKTPEKRKFCSFLGLVEDRPLRKLFIERLSKYKKVDVVTGEYQQKKLQNDTGTMSKIQWLQQYKFNIAFENGIKTGYITEKPIDAILAKTLPVWYGDIETFNKDFNYDQNLLVTDTNIDQVIERIIYLDNHDNEYLQILNSQIIKKGVINDYKNKINSLLQKIMQKKYNI